MTDMLAAGIAGTNNTCIVRALPLQSHTKQLGVVSVYIHHACIQVQVKNKPV